MTGRGSPPAAGIAIESSVHAGPIAWAVAELRAAAAETLASFADARAVRVVVCQEGEADWQAITRVPGTPDDFGEEAFVITTKQGVSTHPITVLVGAAGERGMVYALLELADLVRHSPDPVAALSALRSRYEAPHVGVRSITRLFTSHGLDSVWLHDRSFWDEYLTELATQRFNRFSLAFGLAYDYLIDKRVVDNYLCFAYPFLVDVPGYDVRVAHLESGERERNLASLRYIASAAAQRGLEFGLGLWNHAYRLDPAVPTEHWLISGLDDTTHTAYCAAALELLLNQIPQIGALTFRVHFEGGVPEPTHAFWREVLSGVRRTDRTIRVDAHAKGINDELLAALHSSDSPLTLSTKYWGEHMGLPYHQAGIREKERARQAGGPDTAAESGGRAGADVTRKRSFTRYGYADFIRTDARYGLIHRVWPGTQRVLCTPDAVTSSAIARNAVFGNAEGIEWFDALTFLGKKDSANHPRTGSKPLDRVLYDDALAQPGSATWRKYRPWLRLAGRLAYDPSAEAASWRRWFVHSFGAAAADVEAASAHAARILPLITTVHAPSVAGNAYWPEMDTPIPLIEPEPVTENPYAANGWHLDSHFDMVAPYTFGNTSPLDPELFATPDEYADSLVDGPPEVRYSPLEVADWLDRLGDLALGHVRAADEHRRHIQAKAEDELRRLVIDAAIAAHLGKFFAAKQRAAVAWRLHQRLGTASELDGCLDQYRRARAHWVEAAEVASPYRDDLPFGQLPYQRGHWRDRLAAIDADLGAVAAHSAGCARSPGPPGPPAGMRLTPVRLSSRLEHHPPAHFTPGRPLMIVARVDDSGLEVWLRYRRVDQSQPWSQAPMSIGPDGTCHAEIPADLTRGPYALQYYFILRGVVGEKPVPATALWPGLHAVDFAAQPYFVVHADPETRWGRTFSPDDRQHRPQLAS